MTVVSRSESISLLLPTRGILLHRNLLTTARPRPLSHGMAQRRRAHDPLPDRARLRAEEPAADLRLHSLPRVL